MEESTTFDEAFVDNEARFPSFTLCPQDNSYGNKSIESFEEVTEEIENAKTKFKIGYYDFKSYENDTYEEETYNQTLNNDWYFAPRISEYSPYETVICLIMAPYREQKHNPERSITVSYSNCELCSFNHINNILVSHTTILDTYIYQILFITILSFTISSRRRIPLCLQICRGRDLLDWE